MTEKLYKNKCTFEGAHITHTDEFLNDLTKYMAESLHKLHYKAVRVSYYCLGAQYAYEGERGICQKQDGKARLKHRQNCERQDHIEINIDEKTEYVKKGEKLLPGKYVWF